MARPSKTVHTDVQPVAEDAPIADLVTIKTVSVSRSFESALIAAIRSSTADEDHAQAGRLERLKLAADGLTNALRHSTNLPDEVQEIADRIKQLLY